MADIIPPGAYIIRNIKTSTVLQNNPKDNYDVSCITAAEQDEEKYREQQIWWVEADPGYEELNAREDKTTKEGGVYRISNIATSQSLDSGGDTQGKPVVGYPTHGAPWQLWRFRKRQSPEESYNIVPLHTTNSLDDSCSCRPTTADSETIAWELINPLVPIPAGWLRIRNIASGNILSQTFESLPPVSAPSTSKSSSYPESWALQWAFIRASSVGYSTISNRVYVIRNRLTRAYLSCRPSRFTHLGESPGSVSAWESKCRGDNEFWRLELISQFNWKIVHHKTGFLLEEAVVPLLDGQEVVCTTKTTDRRNTWTFISIKDIDTTTTENAPPPVFSASGSGSAST
ncbi:hypothetical protein K440DRAFT_660799 [Wilcoxina mikolae CBS 423.85]|nr:hypothetical protein K440DRAFT_660799 [Wilcoxina mikolae CBS 423.85]